MREGVGGMREGSGRNENEEGVGGMREGSGRNEMRREWEE